MAGLFEFQGPPASYGRNGGLPPMRPEMQMFRPGPMPDIPYMPPALLASQGIGFMQPYQPFSQPRGFLGRLFGPKPPMPGPQMPAPMYFPGAGGGPGWGPGAGGGPGWGPGPGGTPGVMPYTGGMVNTMGPWPPYNNMGPYGR